MDASGISIQDLVILGGVVGGIIGVSQALIALGDRLWRKPETKAERDSTRQSLECQYQHKEIASTLNSNTEVLKEMVRGNGQLVQTLQSTVEDAKLRHQIIVDKIERIHDAVQQRRNE